MSLQGLRVRVLQPLCLRPAQEWPLRRSPLFGRSRAACARAGAESGRAVAAAWADWRIVALDAIMSLNRNVLAEVAVLEPNAAVIERHLAAVVKLVNEQMKLLIAYDEAGRSALVTAAQCGITLRHRQAWSQATLTRLARLLSVEVVAEPASTALLAPGATLDGTARRDVARLTDAVNALLSRSEAPTRDFTPPRAA